MLISAIRSQHSVSSEFLNLVITEHRLVICTWTITEVSRVIAKRFPDKMAEWDRMISCLECELVYTPTDISVYKAPYIRDEKDLPILVSALIAQPDILVTGDLDFHTPEIQEYFAVYTPSDFLRYFGQSNEL